MLRIRPLSTSFEFRLSRPHRCGRRRSRCACRTPVRHTRARSLRDGFAAFGLSLIVRNLRPVRRPPPLPGSFVGPAPLSVDQQKEPYADRESKTRKASDRTTCFAAAVHRQQSVAQLLPPLRIHARPAVLPALRTSSVRELRGRLTTAVGERLKPKSAPRWRDPRRAVCETLLTIELEKHTSKARAEWVSSDHVAVGLRFLAFIHETARDGDSLLLGGDHPVFPEPARFTAHDVK